MTSMKNEETESFSCAQLQMLNSAAEQCVSKAGFRLPSSLLSFLQQVLDRRQAV